MLPSPADFGLDPRHTAYLPSQEEAVESALADRTRFSAICLPTGGGKTDLAALAGMLLPGRAVILVNTKALQSQYRQTVSFLADVRGQNAYVCLDNPLLTVDQGKCKMGSRCELLETGCLHYDAVRTAGERDLVLTNYAYWAAYLRRTRRKRSAEREPAEDAAPDIGTFDTLVCDEADTAFAAIEQAMKAEISLAQIDRLLGTAMLPAPDTDLSGLGRWSARAETAILDAQAAARRGRSGSMVQQAKRAAELRALAEAVNTVLTAASQPDEWVSEWTRYGFSITPVWPGRYAERYLFGGIPRVILLSGTLSPKAVEMLGVSPLDYTFHDYPSSIPIQNRRVTHIAATPMSRNRADLQIWLNRIDQIISARLDRKILLHTTSYQRRDFFMRNSRHAGTGILITHEGGSASLETAVAAFKEMSAPAVLVSPSIVRGYDFPGDDCRTVILGKVPFPDTRSAAMQRRKEIDPSYPSYEAMLALQQAAGRAVRGRSDWAEIFIVDDDFKWFWRQNRQYASGYFRQAVEWRNGRTVTEEVIPSPPPV